MSDWSTTRADAWVRNRVEPERRPRDKSAHLHGYPGVTEHPVGTNGPWPRFTTPLTEALFRARTLSDLHPEIGAGPPKPSRRGTRPRARRR